MSNLNVGNAVSLLGNTALLSVTTVASNVITVAANSVYRLNTLIVSNVNTAAAAVTIQINRSSTNTAIVQGLPVAANSLSVVIGKDVMIYLLENDVLQIIGSANNYLQAVVSWEQVS